MGDQPLRRYASYHELQGPFPGGIRQCSISRDISWIACMRFNQHIAPYPVYSRDPPKQNTLRTAHRTLLTRFNIISSAITSLIRNFPDPKRPSHLIPKNYTGWPQIASRLMLLRHRRRTNIAKPHFNFFTNHLERAARIRIPANQCPTDINHRTVTANAINCDETTAGWNAQFQKDSIGTIPPPSTIRPSKTPPN